METGKDKGAYSDNDIQDADDQAENLFQDGEGMFDEEKKGEEEQKIETRYHEFDFEHIKASYLG